MGQTQITVDWSIQSLDVALISTYYQSALLMFVIGLGLGLLIKIVSHLWSVR